MKALLLENDGLASKEIYNWVESIVGKDYKEVNPSTMHYMRQDDLHWFGTLINPEIEHLFVASSFARCVDYSCELSFRGGNDDGEETMLQVEYFAWLIYNAVQWRRHYGLPKITLHVEYYGVDLVGEIEDGSLGEMTKLILLAIRQSEGWLTLKVYEDFKNIYDVIEVSADWVKNS